MDLNQVANAINQSMNNTYELPIFTQVKVLIKITKYFTLYNQEIDPIEWENLEKSIYRMIKNHTDGHTGLSELIYQIEKAANKKFLGMKDQSYLPVTIYGPEGEFSQPLYSIKKMGKVFQNMFSGGYIDISTRSLDFSDLSPQVFGLIMSFIEGEYDTDSADQLHFRSLIEYANKIPDDLDILGEIFSFGDQYLITKILQICAYKFFDLHFSKKMIPDNYIPCINLEDAESSCGIMRAILSKIGINTHNYQGDTIEINLESYTLEKLNFFLNKISPYKQLIDTSYFNFRIDSGNIKNLLENFFLGECFHKAFIEGLLPFINLTVYNLSKSDEELEELLCSFETKFRNIFAENYAIKKIFTP